MRKKTIHVSKAERARRPPRPEFAMSGIVIGVFAGEALAVGAEIAIGRANMWIMLAGGIAGLALGSIFEAGRYGWRRRRWNASKLIPGRDNRAPSTH